MVEQIEKEGGRGGSPAEKGGLQGEDVIVASASQKIANSYDWRARLSHSSCVGYGEP